MWGRVSSDVMLVILSAASTDIACVLCLVCVMFRYENMAARSASVGWRLARPARTRAHLRAHAYGTRDIYTHDTKTGQNLTLIDRVPHIPHIPYHVGNDPSVTCARWARVPSIIWNWNSPLASRLCHNLCVVAVGAPLSVIQLVRHRAIDIDSQQAGSPFLNLHGESGREETSQLSKSIRNAGR